MNEITCPNCHKTFSLDDAGFAAILTQVRTAEFDAELHARLAEAEKNKKTEIELAEAKTAERIAKESEQLRTELAELKAKLTNTETEKQLAVRTAVEKAEKERDELKSSLEKAELEKKLGEQSIKDQLTTQIKDRDDEIERLREMKARLSTKMIGETLERHCENEFTRIRAGAFPNAEFHKDNEVVEGTKGDFVFRDFTTDGVEIVSIMFEMKHEMDEGVSKKQTNESFLEKLDKDRKKKGLEYAVLVTTLEPDNELYNSGIVDVSHLYPKMYVVRPQFFIPIITLLRNAAQASLDDRIELAKARNQNIDISNFESKLDDFKTYVVEKYGLASDRFQNAIAAIDKSIAELEKAKKALLTSENHLRLASNEADRVTIKTLTKDSPTVRAKFDELGKSAITDGES